MSGASCPDCGCQFLSFGSREKSGTEASCLLCGWVGIVNLDLREELTEQGYHRCDERFRQRKAGKLGFLRVYPRVMDDNLDYMDEVMRLLGLNSYSRSSGGYTMVVVSPVPSEELLQRLNAIPGIGKVTIN